MVHALEGHQGRAGAIDAVVEGACAIQEGHADHEDAHGKEPVGAVVYSAFYEQRDGTEDGKHHAGEVRKAAPRLADRELQGSFWLADADV